MLRKSKDHDETFADATLGAGTPSVRDDREAQRDLLGPPTDRDARHEGDDAEGSLAGRLIAQLLLGALALALALGLAYFLYTQKTAPATTKGGLPAAPVEVFVVDVINRPLTVQGFGEVRARARVQAVPQVAGRVTSVSDQLTPGGIVRGGETLLQLDETDFNLAVEQAQAQVEQVQTQLEALEAQVATANAELAQARTQLEQQLAEQRVAVKQFKRLNPDEEPPPLVANVPQVRQAQAAVEAALARLEEIAKRRQELEAQLRATRSQLEQARVNLGRTTISLPGGEDTVYRVASKNVDAGQFVQPGVTAATLYRIDQLEVPIPLKPAALRRVRLPDSPPPGPGSDVTLYTDYTGPRRSWPGVVTRLEGEVDPQTRLANVIVTVTDPGDVSDPASLLVPGLFVEAAIDGQRLDDVAVLPVAALRDRPGDEPRDVNQPYARPATRPAEDGPDVGDFTYVWVNDAGKLRFRQVRIVYLGRKFVYVRGLEPGEEVVTTDLPVVQTGMALDVVQQTAPGGS